MEQPCHGFSSCYEKRSHPRQRPTECSDFKSARRVELLHTNEVVRRLKSMFGSLDTPHPPERLAVRATPEISGINLPPVPSVLFFSWFSICIEDECQKSRYVWTARTTASSNISRRTQFLYSVRR